MYVTSVQTNTKNYRKAAAWCPPWVIVLSLELLLAKLRLSWTLDTEVELIKLISKKLAYRIVYWAFELKRPHMHPCPRTYPKSCFFGDHMTPYRAHILLLLFRRETS